MPGNFILFSSCSPLSLSFFVRLLMPSSTTTTTPIISLRRMNFLGSSRSVVFVRCDVEDIFSQGVMACAGVSLPAAAAVEGKTSQ